MVSPSNLKNAPVEELLSLIAANDVGRTQAEVLVHENAGKILTIMKSEKPDICKRVLLACEFEVFRLRLVQMLITWEQPGT